MARILIPFTEPEGATRAVEALLREPRDARLAVHLAAIVEPMRPGKVPMFLSADRAEILVREAGRRWLAPLEARLRAAGIAFSSEVIAGPPRATVTQLTAREDIDRVLLPPPRTGGFTRREGERIRDLSPHPVTLVA